MLGNFVVSKKGTIFAHYFVKCPIGYSWWQRA